MQAAITRGQTFSGSTGATNATSLPLTVTAPNLADGKFHYMIIGVGSISMPWMTDDAGYTFYGRQMNATNTPMTALFVGRIFSGAGTTITVNTFATSAITAIGAEYIADNPIRLDRGAVSSGSSTAPSTGTTQTTSNANELVMAAFCHRTASASTTGSFASFGTYTEVISSPTGGTSTTNNTAGADREVELLEKFVSSTGTQSSTVAVTGVNNWTGVIATFEEVAPASSGQHSSVGTVLWWNCLKWLRGGGLLPKR
jgi:hypothetical protein